MKYLDRIQEGIEEEVDAQSTTLLYGELYGDKFLDTSLMTYFNEKGIIDSGFITQKKQEFHNERTLVKIGSYLEIHSYLNPVDINQNITDNDIILECHK